jgi:FkbM family methyltransferase
VFSQVFGLRQADFPVEGAPGVIVDAGANIGLTTAIFASRFPGARILALELEASNFELLRDNTAFYPNVRTLHTALWPRKARITIANPDAKSWEFQAREAGPHDDTAINAVGIADILAEFSLQEIDLLKIDIEGGEYEVFSGDVSEWIDRVRMIAVEVHDRFRPGCTDVVRKALVGRDFQESRWSEYLLFTRRSSCSAAG